MITKEKFQYTDGKMKGFRHTIAMIVQLGDRLEELALTLSGNTLKPPTIKSPDEAKYQSGTRIFHDNLIALCAEEEETRKEYDRYEREYKDYATFFRKLDDNEIEILRLRYENGFDYVMIAKILYTSHGYVYKKICQILDKW